MTTDEKVALAEEIAGQLVNIPPSEWSKWCSYANRYGLQRALQLASALGNSPSLRPGPKQAYLTIATVLNKFQNRLRSLSQPELAEVLGYVGWSLAGARAGIDGGPGGVGRSSPR
jgi:hypothetical protein